MRLDVDLGFTRCQDDHARRDEAGAVSLKALWCIGVCVLAGRILPVWCRRGRGGGSGPDILIGSAKIMMLSLARHTPYLAESGVSLGGFACDASSSPQLSDLVRWAAVGR